MADQAAAVEVVEADKTKHINMAKKLNEFLKALLQKAGANIEDEALKTALGTVGPDLEIADELATTIDNGLLSLATAKNNYPDLKNHYFGLAYKGLDSELDRLIESEALPEEIVNEIRQEGSSTKRAVKLALKIKELESKKASGKHGDTQKLNDQIADLNNQLRTEKESKKALEDQHKNAVKGVKKSFALNQLLGTYKTIHDTLDPETKNIILSAVLSKHLKAKEADFDVNDTEEFVLVGKNNTNIFGEDNRLLTPKTFIEKVLADEKMLVVSDSNGNGNNGNNTNNNSNRPNGQHFNSGHNNGNNNGGHNNGGNNNNRTGQSRVIQELIKQSQQDIQAAANNPSIM